MFCLLNWCTWFAPIIHKLDRHRILTTQTKIVNTAVCDTGVFALISRTRDYNSIIRIKISRLHGCSTPPLTTTTTGITRTTDKRMKFALTQVLITLYNDRLLGCLAPVQPNSYEKRLNATADLQEVFIWRYRLQVIGHCDAGRTNTIWDIFFLLSSYVWTKQRA